MVTLSNIMLGITAFFLITGALCGLSRGAARSVIRLITVGGAFAFAWMYREEYVSAVLNAELDGGLTIAETIVKAFGEAAAYADIVIPIIESLLGVVLFVGAFIVACAVTNLVYLILKIVFRSKGGKFAGLIIGTLQGALIAFAICAPLNGLLCNAGQILDLEIQGKPILAEETKAEMKEAGFDFEEYRASTICNVYSTIGMGFYNELSSSNMGDGNVSLSATVEAVEAGTKFIGAVESINNIDLSNGLTADSREDLKATFKELNDIKNDMSHDAQKTINTLISTVVTESAEDLQIPEQVVGMIENLDFTTVDFEKEGDLLITVIDYAKGDEEAEVEADNIVDALANSTVITPMIESMVESGEINISVPEEQKADFAAAIESLEDAEMAETIKKILGLN